MLIKNLFRYWTYQVFSPSLVLKEKYECFKRLLKHDKAAHEFMAVLEDMYYSEKKYDFQAVVSTYNDLAHSVLNMVEELLKMCPSRYWSLQDYYKKFNFYNQFMLAPQEFSILPPFTLEFNSHLSLKEGVVGKKAATLTLLNKVLHLPCPEGFIITIEAFYCFLETNGLQETINGKLSSLDIDNHAALEQTAWEIEQLILKADVPKEVELAVINAITRLEQGKADIKLALRSSAVKEDGKVSFAGQYQTVLNVDKNDTLTSYKQVIASKYSAQALYYRISQGILDDETPMAVLVLEMVDSMTSGVMYTKNINAPPSENILIHSVRGQGEQLVDGRVAPDVIEVSKNNPDTIVGIKKASNPDHSAIKPEVMTRTFQTDPEKKEHVCFDEASSLTLARWGILLEEHFNEPQDVEWCQDKSGKLFILQSRPLNMSLKKIQKKPDSEQSVENEMICSDADSVCPGVGYGKVFQLKQLDQLQNILEGSVLVVKHALPQFVTVINRINAIIIETGSIASHFSSIAREYNVPVMVNVKKGFYNLAAGQMVTVDASNCRVYKGLAEPLMKLKKKDIIKDVDSKDSSFMAKLKYVMNFSTRLKLTDPNDPSFAPEACRSFHDIIRFVHETAVKEMFLTGHRKGSRTMGAKKLISTIPMLFYILDVGQGIKDGREDKKTIKPEDIICTPMTAVLKGLSNPGISWAETSHFDWEEYDKIVMSGGIISADSAQFGSYAVVAREYFNVNFRFGYHFVILDAICSPRKEDNYILFRFSGGGGSTAGRSLRAYFIKQILIQLGFIVEIKSDLVDAEYKNGSLEDTIKILDVVGRLLGATKLMDMYLKENLDIDVMIDDFMNGRYDFRTVVSQ